jgi:hypothetical protein
VPCWHTWPSRGSSSEVALSHASIGGVTIELA